MLIAYHNDPKLKAKYLKRVRSHRKADELIQGATAGQTDEGFRGCAVVCTMNKYDHGAYETEIGIPNVLAKLEDVIFEGLKTDEAMAWPEAFLGAVPVGADLAGVIDLFLRWLLVDPQDGVIQYAKTEKSHKAILTVGDMYARKIKGEVIPASEWRSAASDAYAASAYAAYAAASAYASDAAASASAYAASDAASYAASDAAYAAASDASASAYAAAKKSSRSKQAAKLIELLKAAPIPNP